jgi:hypothetical protein
MASTVAWRAHRREEGNHNGQEQLFRVLAGAPYSGMFGTVAPVDVGVRAGQVSAPGHPFVVSADVGPDRILPGRRPSLVFLYVKACDRPFWPRADTGSAKARRQRDHAHSAGPVRLPCACSVAQVQGRDVALADPLQQIWDVLDLGGADRSEAVGRLRQWLLERSDLV